MTRTAQNIRIDRSTGRSRCRVSILRAIVRGTTPIYIMRMLVVFGTPLSISQILDAPLFFSVASVVYHDSTTAFCGVLVEPPFCLCGELELHKNGAKKKIARTVPPLLYADSSFNMAGRKYHILYYIQGRPGRPGRRAGDRDGRGAGYHITCTHI